MSLTKLQGQLVSNTTTLNVASANINGNLIVNSTGSIVVPVGTTPQRPSADVVGSIRYNTTTGFFELCSSSGWTSIANPPLVTNVSPTTYSGASGTQFTITGSFFDVTSTVKFITTQGTEYNASSVTFVSQSQLLATTPQNFTVANEPLSIKVVGGSGLSYTLSGVIDCGSTPTWNTSAGSLGSYDANTAFNTTLVATDPDANSTITYSI